MRSRGRSRTAVTARLRARLIGFAVVLLIGFVLVGGTTARPARAHANLVSSVPAAGARLSDPPDHVEMTFSEPPDLKFSGARVLRSDRSVAVENAVLSSPDSATLTFPLPHLEEGSYTVAWRAVSSIDGHPTAGAFSFAVGNVAVVAAAPAEAGAPGGGPGRIWLAAGKLFSYLAFALALLLTVVLPWTIGKEPGKNPRLHERWSRTQSRASQACAAAVLLSAGFALFLQAWTSEGGLDALQLSGTWTLVTSTRFGTTWQARLGLSLLAGCALLFPGLRRLGRPARRILAAMGALAALALPFSVSWNSHLAADGLSLQGGGIVDGMHMVAATIWIGGLVLLTGVAVRHRGGGEEETVRRAFARFTPVGATCAALLLSSGVFSWWRLVGGISDTVTTGYGQLVVVKTGLLLIMLVLALRHLMLGRGGRSFPNLGRLPVAQSIAAESVFGIAALLVAAFLSNQSPPSEPTFAAAPPGSQVYADRDGETNVRLIVAPGVAGQNLLTFEVAGLPASETIDRFIVRLTYEEDEIGTMEGSATPLGSGRFILDGSQLSLPGRWKVEILTIGSGGGAAASYEVTIRAP